MRKIKLSSKRPRKVLRKIVKKREHITEEDIYRKAAKFNVRQEFKNHEKAAYMRAYRMGILDAVCDHMRHKWSVETLKAEFLKYPDVKSIKDGSPSAYSAAKRLGCFDELTEFLPKGNLYKHTRESRWNRQTILDILPNYKNITEFCNGKLRAYRKAVELGMREEIREYYKRE